MSSVSKRRLAAFLIVIGTVAFLGVVHWVSDPAPSSAGDLPKKTENRQHGGASPDVSIVFVIDSSQSMFPPLGPTYFDLAKQGIAEFLRLPGFSKDDGTYEISVIQYAERTAPGYTQGTPESPEGAQWFGPVHLTAGQYADGDTKWKRVVEMVENLKPSTHFSASLMELGIREATTLLTTESAGDSRPLDLPR